MLIREHNLASGHVARAKRHHVQFLLLVYIGAMAAFARYALSPLQESLRLDLNLSDNQVALLQGPALALPFVFAAIPLGLAIDRVKRVRLLAVFVILNSVACALPCLFDDFGLLIFSRCLAGLSVAAIATTVISLSADLYPAAQRGRAKAVLAIGQYIGLSAAFAAGGYLLDRAETPSDWRVALAWLSAPVFLSMIAIVFVSEPARRDVAMRPQRSRDTWHKIWKLRALVGPIMLGLVLLEIAIFAVLSWAAPVLIRVVGLSPAQAGATMGTSLLLSGIVGPTIGGGLADYCQQSKGPSRTIAALAILIAVAGVGACFPLSSSLWLTVGALTLFVLTGSAGTSMGITLFTIVVPNELRGISLSIFGAATSLFGLGIAPLAVSLLSGLLGGSAMIGPALSVVSVSACLAGAAVMVTARRPFQSVRQTSGSEIMHGKA